MDKNRVRYVLGMSCFGLVDTELEVWRGGGHEVLYIIGLLERVPLEHRLAFLDPPQTRTKKD